MNLYMFPAICIGIAVSLCASQSMIPHPGKYGVLYGFGPMVCEDTVLASKFVQCVGVSPHQDSILGRKETEISLCRSMDTTHAQEAQQARSVASDCVVKLARITGHADTLEREHGNRLWVAAKNTFTTATLTAAALVVILALTGHLR